MGTLAVDSVGVASLAAQLLSAERRGTRPGPLRVDGVRVAASFRSDRVLRLDGRGVTAFAPLSGFWATADGWVRTHANYPHHAARLAALLDLPAGAGPGALRGALADRSALELEDSAATAGALVVAVRTAERWSAHPQAQDVARAPLVRRARLGPGPAQAWSTDPGAPLAGVRVLDLTRVIAGPVAGRDLALMGATVLRVDPPAPAEIPWQHLDTGQDKRSALLDLAGAADRRVFEDLLGRADVVLTGYRPGSLDRFGLAADDLAARHPGVVVGSVDAWGTSGPWAHRRGFDSLVQAVSGIAVRESRDGGVPGALPAQALDHGSGHLLAAGVVCALRDQRTGGGSHAVSVSLARTAHALLRLAGPTAGGDPAVEDPTVTSAGVTCAAPVLAHDKAPRDYAWVGAAWGGDPARW